MKRPLFHLISLSLFGLLISCSSGSNLFKTGNVTNELFYKEIPVREANDVRILEVDINGKSYSFLFDTGAPNVIDQSLAKELGLESIHNSKVNDSQGNTNKLDFVRLDGISIAGIEFESTTAIVADFSAVPEFGCLGMDGIIGANLMRHCYWKIDPVANVITFTNQLDSLSIPQDALKIPFRQKGTYTPMVDVQVGELKISNATFDTGSGGTISLYKSWLDTDSMVIVASYGYHSAGLYGRNKDSLWYAQLPITMDSSVLYLPTLVRLRDSKQVLLGMEYLERYDIYLNWDQSEISLVPIEGFEAKKKGSYGFSPAYMDGKLIIGSIIVGSDLHKAGVEVGTEILAIDRWAPDSAEISDYCHALDLLLDAEDDIKLVLKDGNSITLERRAYFKD